MNTKKHSIDKAPLGQKAADVIRSRIMEGEYPQGSRLIEEELASEFNISRACVRDAFLMLESEGMVKRERNKYTKVLTLTQKDIEDLFRFRQALELASIEICMEKKRVPFDKLKQSLRSLDRILKKNGLNALEFVQADMNFHEAIIASSQNTYIINTFKSIQYQLMTLLIYLCNRFKEDFSLHGAEQHQKLADLMEKGDITAAQEHLKAHIRSNLDYVMTLSERAVAL